MEDLINVSRTVTEGYKVWLALAGLVLAFGWTRFDKKTAFQLLLGFTIVAGLNYGRWGPRLLTEQIDVYDLAHYYLNAKYYDELGYYDLYPAMMLADHENDGPYYEEGSKYMAQTEKGHGFEPIVHGVLRGKVVKETKFTPERWKQFSHDSLYLQRTVRPGFNSKLWRQMLQDHGFNGTPAWVMLARPLASVTPVEHVKWICQLDLILLLGALLAVAWAYDPRTALFATFFLSVSYSLRWPTVSWSYLRYDWVAGLMLAMVLLKKGKHFPAGLVAGYTAVLRFFPAMWMWGPLFKGLAGLVRGKVHKQLLVLAGGFLVSAAVLEGAAVVMVGPTDTKVHFENMMDHNSAEQLSSRRIGLALALPFRGKLKPKYIEPARKKMVERQKPIRYGLAVGFMCLMGWGLRRARDDEAYGFGFLPFFLLTTASYYYYVARITLVILHASDMSKLRNRVGLGILFGLELFSSWAETTQPGHRVFLIGYLSWGLCLYAVTMCGWMLWESHQAEKAEANGDGETTSQDDPPADDGVEAPQPA